MKLLKIIFILLIVVSIIVTVAAFVMRDDNVEDDGNVTIVRTPEQGGAEWPDAIPDPREFMVQLPDTPNLAEGRPVYASSHTDIYVPTNAVDGELTSYWESEGFPATFIIELDGVRTIQTVAVSLNPSSLWEMRTQAFEIQVSNDGDNFQTIVDEDRHEFDPLTGNTVRVDFEPTDTQYVRLVFTYNSATRTQGAQAAEIMIFG